MQQLYYSYILYSSRYDRFYIGQTKNLQFRLSYHNGGKVKSTRSYIPWEVVWFQEHKLRSLAMQEERKIKNLKSHKRICAYMLKNGEIISGSTEFLKKIRVSS